jgi:hypothetical protein
MSSAQQVSSSSSSAAAGVNNVKQQLNYPRNNWSDSKDSQLKEKDSSSSSSFELRLGQPSQYTQPSGSSISSSVASASSIEHQKSLLAEQVMHRGNYFFEFLLMPMSIFEAAAVYSVNVGLVVFCRLKGCFCHLRFWTVLQQHGMPRYSSKIYRTFQLSADLPKFPATLSTGVSSSSMH